MRILQLCHRYPPRRGGVEKHVEALATRLASLGHDVSVWTADAGPEVANRTEIDDVRVRRFKSLSPGEAFYVAPRLLSALLKENFDVVHAHNYHALPLLFGALGARDAKFVVTPHYHGESANPLRDATLSVYRPFGMWAVRRADTVLAVSDWERCLLDRDFGVDAVKVPNGVEMSRFVNVSPEQRDCPYLLTVGRLERYKRVQDIIRALPDIPDHELLVAGDGPYKEALGDSAAAADVADRVHFLGYVESERLPGLYAGADAYITLSTVEAYGMTVAEAIAAGTPCVVRDAKALSDWCSTVGVVCVEDSAAVADAVRTARRLEPDPTASLQTWDEMTERVLDVYST